MSVTILVFCCLLFLSSSSSSSSSNSSSIASQRQAEELSVEALLSWGRLGHQLVQSVDRLESSRMLAALHVALHDTVTTIRNKYGAYWYALPGFDEGASGQAAVAAAARTVLLEFFPGNATQINAKYDQYVSPQESLPTVAERDGVIAGEVVARAVMRSMEMDGSQESPPGFDSYKPQWATLQPWCIQIGPRKRLIGPRRRLIGDGGMGTWMLDGSSSAIASATYRGEDEIRLALDRQPDQNRCKTRPETIAELALSAAETAHLEFEDTARLMALVSLSMADATILAWAVKHEYDTPTTAQYIRNLSASFAQWTPSPECYVDPEDTGSPGDYIDLHSTVAAAGLAVVRRAFGNNPPFYIYLAAPSNQPIVVTDISETIDALCTERARSGAVFNTSAVMGVEYGALVGNWIFNHCLPREPMTTEATSAQTTTMTETPYPDDSGNDTDTDTDPYYTDPPWPVSDFMDVRRLGFLLACCLSCVLVTSLVCCCCRRCKCKCCRRPCCLKRQPPYSELVEPGGGGGAIEMGQDVIVV